jgi:hypothetical protein
MERERIKGYFRPNEMLADDEKEKFLSLCCIVTNTEWNGIIKLIIEVKCIRTT